MKKAIKDFLTLFNKQGTMRLWAFFLYAVGWMMVVLGVCSLIMHYAPPQPSLVEAWVLIILGLGFYVLSCWGWEFPRKEVKRKQKSH